MLRSLSKKLCISLLIIPLMISLTSMGIRLPNLTGFSTGAPKPRPRAVMTNQIKKCNETIQQLNLEMELPVRFTWSPPASIPLSIRTPLITFCEAFNLSRSSRSPPIFA